MFHESLLPLGSVGAAEGSDLLIFRLGFKCLGKDRSLVALDSSYNAAQREQAPSSQGHVFGGKGYDEQLISRCLPHSGGRCA
ncbi:hypothetical protein EMIT043CA1_20293 [Pseudomonas brassicacearum]